MSKGIKLLVLGVVILAISSVVGFLSVLYVFDVLPNGEYTIEKMLVDDSVVRLEDSGYEDMYRSLARFSVHEREFKILEGDRLPNLAYKHRLRGGFFGDLFLELQGFDHLASGDWVRFNGESKSLYEKVTVSRGKVVWEIASTLEHGKLTWVYSLAN